MCCSFGGGSAALAVCYLFFEGKIKVSFVLNCVLGSLAAITGTCYMVRMYEALMIGFMSGIITFLTLLTMERLPIDDPCGSFAVHGTSFLTASNVVRAVLRIAHFLLFLFLLFSTF